MAKAAPTDTPDGESPDGESNVPADFESGMAELEALVNRLESGDLGLEEALKAFEQGVKLTRACQQQLSQAEQRVTRLVEENKELKLVGFDDSE